MVTNKWPTEWLLVMICMLHVIMAPYTKVEESFNLQAIHDFLYHRLNFSEYDHHEFPGVVPRTFMGALAISAPLFPVANYLEWRNIVKHWMLYAARFVLGLTVLFTFCQFAKRIDKHFGRLSGDFLRLIVVSQFHFMFYCSRTLPNTFALIGVLWTYQKILDGKWIHGAQIATVFTLLFRCELALFYACIFIIPILTRQIPLFGWNGAIIICCFTAALILGISVPIDSFLWQRWVWPEGEVWWFNVILNRSHEYGVLPYLWYFYSAIPRALMASTIFVPLGALFDRRLIPLLVPVVCYILLYSFLPHKELRFIIYTFPILNVSAAVLCARIWINRWKSLFGMIMAAVVIVHFIVNVIGTSTFLYASSRNYPGGEALTSLQYLESSNQNKAISIYIDNYAAQTGVSRFLQWYKAWEYNKSESLEPSQLARFDFLLIGSYTEPDIAKVAALNFSSTHRILYHVGAFRGTRFGRIPSFPYYWLQVKIQAQLVVLKKLNSSIST